MFRSVLRPSSGVHPRTLRKYYVSACLPRHISVCGGMLSVHLYLRCTCQCGVWMCTKQAKLYNNFKIKIVNAKQAKLYNNFKIKIVNAKQAKLYNNFKIKIVNAKQAKLYNNFKIKIVNVKQAKLYNNFKIKIVNAKQAKLYNNFRDKDVELCIKIKVRHSASCWLLL